MPCERVCDWKTFRRRAGRRVGVWLRTFVACHIVAAACLCCCAACNIVGATCCCRCCCCWRCFLFDSAYKCCNVQLLNSSAAAATFKWLRLPQKLCAFVPLKCNPQIVQNPEKKTLPYPWSSRNKTNAEQKKDKWKFLLILLRNILTKGFHLVSTLIPRGVLCQFI